MIPSRLFPPIFLTSLLPLAATSPVSQSDGRQLAAERAIRAKAALVTRDSPRDRGLDECFSDGAICLLDDPFTERCDAIDDENNPQEWYSCLCTTGWTSIQIAYATALQP